MFSIPSPDTPRFVPHPLNWSANLRTRTDEFSCPLRDFPDCRVEASECALDRAACRARSPVRAARSSRPAIPRFRMNDPLSRLGSCPLQPARSPVLGAKRTAAVCRAPFSLRGSLSLSCASPRRSSNASDRAQLSSFSLQRTSCCPQCRAVRLSRPLCRFEHSTALGRATTDSRVASSGRHAQRCWPAPRFTAPRAFLTIASVDLTDRPRHHIGLAAWPTAPRPCVIAPRSWITAIDFPLICTAAAGARTGGGWIPRPPPFMEA